MALARDRSQCFSKEGQKDECQERPLAIPSHCYARSLARSANQNARQDTTSPKKILFRAEELAILTVFNT